MADNILLSEVWSGGMEILVPTAGKVLLIVPYQAYTSFVEEAFSSPVHNSRLASEAFGTNTLSVPEQRYL